MSTVTENDHNLFDTSNNEVPIQPEQTADDQTSNSNLFNDDFDFNDNPMGSTENAEPVKKKAINRARIEFDTFVGVKVTENKTTDENNEVVVTKTETPYDKIWEDLFLKRVALFPTFQEANNQANRDRMKVVTPHGTAPWFEGTRPTSVPAEVFHLECLLLRIREWVNEVRPVKHDLSSFAHRMQVKTADVKSVNAFADHRLDMIKRFAETDWMNDAMNFIELKVNQDVQKKEELEKAKMENMFETLRNINPQSYKKTTVPSYTVPSYAPPAPPSSRGPADSNMPVDVDQNLQEKRQQLLLRRKQKLEQKQLQERKDALLAKRRAKQEAQDNQNPNG